MVRIDRADLAADDLQRGFANLTTEQNPAAFDENVRHDAALRRWVWERPERAADSYFARKSSTASLRKSGRALRRVSWSQSHHASAASRWVTASENRRLIVRAGFPATMVWAGTSLVTMAPAATTAPVPTLRPGSTMAPCPIQTSWPIWTRCSRRHSKNSCSSLSPGK